MPETMNCKRGVAGSISGQDLHKKKSKPEYDWRIFVANARRP